MSLENQSSFCCSINERSPGKSILHFLCWPLTFEELNFFLSSVGHFRILVVCRLYGSFLYFRIICFWWGLNRRYSTRKKNDCYKQQNVRTARRNRLFSLEQISQIVASNLRHLEIFALYAQFCLNQYKTGRHNALPLRKNWIYWSKL